jgi:hypothetical protein
VNSWSWTRRIEGSRAQREAAAELLKGCVRDKTSFDLETAARLLAQTSPEIILGLATTTAGGMVYGNSGRSTPLCRSLPSCVNAMPGRFRDTCACRNSLTAPVLDATGARWAVIKGPAAVEILYSAPGQRAYNDLDLLVDPGAFRDVLTALEASGSELLDRNWARSREMLGDSPAPAPAPLDLHWNQSHEPGPMWIDSAKSCSGAAQRIWVA